jgi:hypothetical protein
MKLCLVSKVLKLKTVVDNCDHVVSEMLILHSKKPHTMKPIAHRQAYHTTILEMIILEAENSLSVEPSILNYLVNAQKQSLES